MKNVSLITLTFFLILSTNSIFCMEEKQIVSIEKNSCLKQTFKTALVGFSFAAASWFTFCNNNHSPNALTIYQQNQPSDTDLTIIIPTTCVALGCLGYYYFFGRKPAQTLPQSNRSLKPQKKISKKKEKGKNLIPFKVQQGLQKQVLRKNAKIPKH